MIHWKQIDEFIEPNWEKGRAGAAHAFCGKKDAPSFRAPSSRKLLSTGKHRRLAFHGAAPVRRHQRARLARPDRLH